MFWPKIDRVVDAIADGSGSAALHQKLTDLERQKTRLEAEKIEFDLGAETIEVPTDFTTVYRQNINELETLVTDDTEEGPAARQILRSLIDQIVVYPGKRRGQTEIHVVGCVASILRFGNAPPSGGLLSVSVGKVVPGDGVEPPTLRFSVACSTN